MNTLQISVIVTTYNWPEALDRVLSALSHQDYRNFEVIVADDGSTDATKAVIENHQKKQSYALHHVWQADEGFRAAAIRNKAIIQASGEYIVFLDGDCIPRSHFLSRHAQLSEPRWFVTGNRVLLSQPFTDKLILTQQYIEDNNFIQLIQLRIMGKINRITPLIKLPPGNWRYKNREKWEGAITCNLAVWRDDLYKINGFNQQYHGWGYEDSDLVIRLINSGKHRKEGRYAVGVIHLWHKENDRNLSDININLLKNSIQNKTTITNTGIKNYGTD